MRSIVKTTSWMDWWTFALESLCLQSSSDSRLNRHLSLAGSRWQLLVAKMTSTVWANIILTRHDAVLVKVKDSVSFESFMDLRNARLSSTDLFPADVLEKAVVRSSKVLHHGLSVMQLLRNSPNKLQKAKASSSSYRPGKGKKFCGFLASLTAAGGMYTQPALPWLAVLQSQQVACSGAPRCLQGAIPSPACVTGTSGASVLISGVGVALALRKVSKILRESAWDPVDQPVQGFTASCSWWCR